MNSLRRLATERAMSGSSSGSGVSSGGSPYSSADATGEGHDARQQRARHARLLLICSCILSALARMSGVTSKCPPNSFR